MDACMNMISPCCMMGSGAAPRLSDDLPTLLEPENVDQLKAVLLRHVLPTTILAGDIPEGSTTVDTAGGETITVTNADGVTIESSAGKATVIATDVVTSNGVVHIVNTVF